MHLPNIGTVITTNYDFCLEESVGAPVVFDTRVREARYNLFRRSSALDKDVWHIHGRHDQPGTITLGFDHYAGYLQKLRNYATSGISSKDHGGLRSPLAHGRSYFELRDDPYSWLDVFLRHDVHVVGFGFDYSELDTWWALVLKHQVRHRARMRPMKGQVGTTHFYYPRFGAKVDSALHSKVSLLKSFGVEVIAVDVSDASYSDFYRRVIDRISTVPKYRWADVPPSHRKSDDDYLDKDSSEWRCEWEARKAQLDLNLPSPYNALRRRSS